VVRGVRRRAAGGALIRVIGGLALVGAMATPAAAQSVEPPLLWQPEVATAFLLAEEPVPPVPSTRAPWNGSLADALVRGLFGTYRAVLSSQDLPLCAFSPSCSRFSQRAIDRCGFFVGTMLTVDRLLRDHPLAIRYYSMQPRGRLLEDDVERYCPTVVPPPPQ
jgi:putative component of membrane protein insertase Oxa1/YidC/SpoIIIJ protein YidD